MFTPTFRATAAPLILRVGLAVIVLFHGCLKLIVTHGGVGWDSHLPPAVQAAVAWTEVIAGVLLMAGLLSRVAALALMVIQVGAIILVTGDRGFALGSDIGTGPHPDLFNFAWVGTEYNFAIIVMCITLMLLGSGVVSVDHLLARRRKAAAPPSPGLQPVG